MTPPLYHVDITFISLYDAANEILIGSKYRCVDSDELHRSINHPSVSHHIRYRLCQKSRGSKDDFYKNRSQSPDQSPDGKRCCPKSVLIRSEPSVLHAVRAYTCFADPNGRSSRSLIWHARSSKPPRKSGYFGSIVSGKHQTSCTRYVCTARYLPRDP